MAGEGVWHLGYGCVFLALNTAVGLGPAWLLGRSGGRTAAVVVGLVLGVAGSFALGQPHQTSSLEALNPIYDAAR